MIKEAFQTIETKLCQSRLSDRGDALIGISDTSVLWNKDDEACHILEKVFDALDIRAILFSQPAEPYRTIINYLAENSNGERIQPQDCETRYFLHDLPILSELSADVMIPILKTRKSIIFPGHGILTYGATHIEQAYTTFSSVCFACFVKFFSDYLYNAKERNLNQQQQETFDRAVSHLRPFPALHDSLIKGPFASEKEIHASIEEAGKLTVGYGLVDSCFGNISYYDGNTLYISKTGSFLDNLKEDIIPCSIEDIPCERASSELPAHQSIVKKTGNKAILHGHPIFSVILSMDCDVKDCKNRGECHLKCAHEREICDIPIVPGEIGGGEYGLCHTVPEAIEKKNGVIVFGHGVFAVGKTDFNEPFQNLLEIEHTCRKEYFRRVRGN